MTLVRSEHAIPMENLRVVYLVYGYSTDSFLTRMTDSFDLERNLLRNLTILGYPPRVPVV